MQGETTENIKKTFRRLAREYHPDRRQGKGDDKAARAIQSAWYAMKEAHEVLTDERRREMYDETGFKSEEDMMAELERQRQREDPAGGRDGYTMGPPGWPQQQGPPGWAPWDHPGASLQLTASGAECCNQIRGWAGFGTRAIARRVLGLLEQRPRAGSRRSSSSS